MKASIRNPLDALKLPVTSLDQPLSSACFSQVKSSGGSRGKLTLEIHSQMVRLKDDKSSNAVT